MAPKCRYCDSLLAPLRSLTDGEFCCDEHRSAFFARKTAGPGSLASLHSAVTSQEVEAAPAVCERLFPLRFDKNTVKSPDCGAGRSHGMEPRYPGVPCLPRLEARPWIMDSAGAPSAGVPAAAPAAAPPSQEEQSGVAIPHPSRDIAASWRWLRDVWRNAPSDLKIITVLLPVLLSIALSPSLPRIRIAKVAGGDLPQMVAGEWKSLQQSIATRAAVEYADDFRSGLDAWDSRSNLTTSWSYDAAGFVRPGPLAIFRPTSDLTDYRFEFLGEIDQKGMGCAFRAADLDNYYALKLVVAKPGPLPVVHLVRYAVINGKEGQHTEKPLPFTVRSDMLYRVLLDVRGGDFTIMAQGQVVDFWTDNRLQKGGVGFFCGRGERARVRWVEVSHQYDALGRLCAYLAPYGIESRNGNWN